MNSVSSNFSGYIICTLEVVSSEVKGLMHSISQTIGLIHDSRHVGFKIVMQISHV